MCDECRRNEKGIFSGLVLGGLIGAGLYFLFGTEEGKKMQKELKKRGEKAADKLQDLVSELEEKGSEFKEKALEVAEEVKEEVGDRVDDFGLNAKEELKEKLDTAFEKIDDLQAHGRDVTHSVHSTLNHKLFKNIPKK